MKSPIKVAKEIAEMIKNDPVAACQVKEYIKPQELIKMLELENSDNRVQFALATVKDLQGRLNNLSDELDDLMRDLGARS